MGFYESARRQRLVFLCFFVVAICAAHPALGADTSAFPVCSGMEDSLLTAAPGLVDILHAFGEDTTQYDNEFDIPSQHPAFAQVFELYVSDGVSDRWTGIDPV